MRVIEIAAAVVAERLMDNGTQFIMDPNQVIWPDGKITKMPSPQKKGRARTKKVPATSKNGVFSKIIQSYGPKGGSVATMTNEVEVILPSSDKSDNEGASTSKSEGTAGQKRRGIYK